MGNTRTVITNTDSDSSKNIELLLGYTKGDCKRKEKKVFFFQLTFSNPWAKNPRRDYFGPVLWHITNLLRDWESYH